MLTIRQTKAYNFLLAPVLYLCIRLHNFSPLWLGPARCQQKWLKQWLCTTTKAEIKLTFIRRSASQREENKRQRACWG